MTGSLPFLPKNILQGVVLCPSEGEEARGPRHAARVVSEALGGLGQAVKAPDGAVVYAAASANRGLPALPRETPTRVLVLRQSRGVSSLWPSLVVLTCSSCPGVPVTYTPPCFGILPAGLTRGGTASCLSQVRCSEGRSLRAEQL